MGNKFDGSIYRILSHEPVNTNKIANKLEISHKTTFRALIHLVLMKQGVLQRFRKDSHVAEGSARILRKSKLAGVYVEGFRSGAR